MSLNKDLLSALVDYHFRESEGYIDGKITHSSFQIPRDLLSHTHHFPLDRYNQDQLVSALPPTDPGSCSLFVLNTSGDGDCLLHAASIAMWGKDDSNRFLRGLLTMAFSSERLLAQLLGLWCAEERRRDASMGYPDARDMNILQSEFMNAVDTACNVGCYLEGIHIAGLSHILRRPIICYTTESAAGVSGQSLGGIYLPVLHNPHDCCRVPLAVLYTSLSIPPDPEAEMEQTVIHASHVGHFSAVVCGEGSYYPLVSRSLSPLPLQYSCLGAESRDDQQLLGRYLHISYKSYVSCTGHEGGLFSDRICVAASIGKVNAWDDDARMEVVTSTVHAARSRIIQEALNDKKEQVEELRRRISVVQEELRGHERELEESEARFLQAETAERRLLRKLQEDIDMRRVMERQKEEQIRQKEKERVREMQRDERRRAHQRENEFKSFVQGEFLCRTEAEDLKRAIAASLGDIRPSERISDKYETKRISRPYLMSSTYRGGHLSDNLTASSGSSRSTTDSYSRLRGSPNARAKSTGRVGVRRPDYSSEQYPTLASSLGRGVRQYDSYRDTSKNTSYSGIKPPFK
mmetsp:Transcript_21163/g.30609  ORF Transcript_21163/g.30609 Transcript_21163/m.30609 type:complete len:576 (+) Transcript_21163:103-1830(+)|eukprot:CAMPEP_0185030818 /NCGR_PEP_ID=MMETSP1103-20130426/17897_1 /TAXON_ID=36769 /ORGANISM="Paraphysomonas bandaiensis, Strain Caron Lab Isolate" /LENGTH=575 /DNA_ID=CAMNT_0027566087 /DNA_START=42 /DNA_END=1769 /DNA_ORIENTATION=-